MRVLTLLLLCWLASSCVLVSSTSPSASDTAAGTTGSRLTVPLSATTPESWAAVCFGNDPLLMEAVCGWETRGERAHGNPDRARGDQGEAVGRCQVQIGTAAYLLGWTMEDLTPQRRAALAWLLEVRAVNGFLANAEYAACAARNAKTERAVHCYQGGRWARWRGPTIGTKNVLERYARARLKHMM